VTVPVNDGIDRRYYDGIRVTIRPQTIESFEYDMSLCQTACDTFTTLTLNFTDTVSDPWPSRQYLQFPNHSYPKLPGIFVLEGSEITFAFTHINGTLFRNSTVTLYMFTNVDDCRLFRDGNEATPLSTINLTQREGFGYTFTANRSDYICIVIVIPDGTFFNYTTTGSLLQFHNLSKLILERLCENMESTTVDTGTPDEVKALTLTLKRPLSTASATSSQLTCVLLVVSDINAPTFVVLNTTSVTFWTNKNVGVVSLCVCALVCLILPAGFFLLACVYVSPC
jgi:hypothetical protein